MKTNLQMTALLLLGLLLLNPVFADVEKSSNIYDGVILWSYKTNGGVYSSPLIHNGIVYIGSHDTYFYALNAQTGEEIWKHKTDHKIRSTATCTEDIICFESGNILYGLDFDGNLIWKTTLYNGVLNNKFDNWDFFHSSPVIHDGIAYIGTQNGKTLGINIENGEIIFDFQTGKKENGIRVNPVIYEDKLFFGDWNGLFSAVDINNDSLIWHYNVTPERLWNGGLSSIQTHPVVFNDAVYFSGRSSVFYALDINTGEKRWSYGSPTNEWLVGGLTLADSVLYFGSSNQKMVHAMDPISGEILWRTNVHDGHIFGKPCVDGDYVVAGTGYDDPNLGSLVVLNKETGELINRFEFNNQVQSSPMIVDNIIYFGCVNGNIYAIDKEAVINIPRPILQFNSESLKLNNVPSTETNFDTTFTIYNVGAGNDSISISWGSYSSLNKTAMTITPSEFLLAPADSQKITIKIDATCLSTGTSYIFFNINSHYALSNKLVRKTGQIEVVEVTGIFHEGSKSYNFSLKQNYPNPFNPSTKIEFSVDHKAHALLNVYNIKGEKVKTLVNEQKSPGVYQVSLDGTNLANGVYFYHYTLGIQTLIKKMMLIK